MEKYKRIIIVVMDSLGIGNAKDANLFSQEGKPDTGANTFNHIAEKYPDIRDRSLPRNRNPVPRRPRSCAPLSCGRGKNHRWK